MIKTGSVATQIEEIRVAKSNRGNELADRLKRQLPAFTPSGVFGKGHRKEHLQEYNPLIVLDIDKVGSEKATELKKKAAGLATTYAAFISPSGDGLKILIQTDNEATEHSSAYQQVADYYALSLAVDIDLSGKDISRLCFVSYDPEIFINDKVVVFSQKSSITEAPTYTLPIDTADAEIFQHAVSFTEKLEDYFPGNRNNYIYLLACNLNRTGVDRSTAEKLICEKYSDLEKSEVIRTVASAYKKTDEFGTFSPDYFGTVTTVNHVSYAITNQKKNRLEAPEIPQTVYDALPEFLKRATSVFDLNHERDIFLTSALATLSACFPSLSGIYDKRRYHANLFTFIIGGPGIGKGNAMFARTLVERIHESIVEKYQASTEDRNLPQSFFVAADISASAIKRNLKWNNGVGLIHDSEADTLSNTLEQDWGGHSEIYRKAFQHEPISYTRNGRGEEIITGEIKRPKLSICLTGTPSQVPSLLKGTEDGLFSRIIFYYVARAEMPVFKSVFSDSADTDLNCFFEGLSADFFENYYLPVTSRQINFQMEKSQTERFHETFNRILETHYLQSGDGIVGIVYRLGLITFRIAMILTILRNVSEKKFDSASTIECTEVDFQTSLTLSEVYLQHALALYNSFPGKRNENKSHLILHEFLPDSFTYTGALNIGTRIFGFSEKTVSNYLSILKTQGYLTQPRSKGEYYKVSPT